MIMRILISAWSFYPSQEGGPSNAIYWLASGLARAGHSVRVVTTNRCQRDGDVVTNTWNRLNDFDVIYETLDSLTRIRSRFRDALRCFSEDRIVELNADQTIEALSDQIYGEAAVLFE